MKISWKTGGMKNIKCSDHEIKKSEDLYVLRQQNSDKQKVVRQITQVMKNAGKFYQLVRATVMPEKGKI
jgi:hypothetical protein